jgi:nucleoid DNA-binding protein
VHSRGSPSPPSDRAPLAVRASRFDPSVIVSRTKTAELVQAVLDEICGAAERGETVKLSSFGSFVVRPTGQPIGRNPKTDSSKRRFCRAG